MKTEVLKFFFAALLSLITIFPAFAAKDVTLTGSIIGVTAEYKYGATGKDRYYYRINTTLQFKNESNEPIIILKPEWFYGTKRVSFTNDYSSDSMSFGQGIEFKVPDPWGNYGRSLNDQDKIGDFLRKLIGKEPTSAFVIIPVDGFYECRD